MIKSIETYYKGYLCRSRTEARWLVAFDKAGIKYEYEPEGFDLGSVGKYLPDLYLPQVDMYAEVKGRPFNIKELKKAKALALGSKKVVLLLDGAPARKAYWGIHPDDWPWYVTFQNEDFCICDYDIFEHSNYWLNENRFFSATSNCGLESFPLSHDNGMDDESDSIAVRASRSARFEHHKK